MLLEVTERPLNPQELIDHVRKDEASAVVLFFGVVRNHSGLLMVDRHLAVRTRGKGTAWAAGAPGLVDSEPPSV